MDIETRREKRREYYRKYYREHKEEIAGYQRKYVRSHKEQTNARARKYQAKHRQPQRDRMNRYHETKEGRATNLLNSYRQYDLRKGWENTELTREYIMRVCFSEGCRCVYCGNDDWQVLGLDRIKNDEPHVPLNTVCCCKRCNTSRHRRTLEGYLNKMSMSWDDFMRQNGAGYGDDYIVINQNKNKALQ